MSAGQCFAWRTTPCCADRLVLSTTCPVKPGTLHAAILRSPHPHAEIISIDTSEALRRPGVAAVITREDILRPDRPFIIGLTTPLEYRCLAIDRVRFVGEPVAVVLASDRYRAEDALDEIKVIYQPLPAVVDPVEATRPEAPILHPKVGSNIVVSRDYVHGDIAGAFAAAPHRTELTVHFPRNSIPPIEGFAVLADYLGEEDGYDTVSNFQGPFSLHTVMARALRIQSGKLRVRTAPNSGGAFGVKLVLYASIVLMCVASRVARRPVKWIEDRLEHLAPPIPSPTASARSRLPMSRMTARCSPSLSPLGRSWRLFARADAGADYPRPRFLHRRLRDSGRSGNDRRHHDQQDADRGGPRLRCAANPFRPRAHHASDCH